MRRGLKFLGILAVLACAGLANQSVFANCISPDSSYPINQCGRKTWFAPPPAGSGAVNAVWWQLGFGNNQRSRTTASSGDIGSDGGAWVTTGGTCVTGACTNGICTTGPAVGTDCSANGAIDCGRCTAGTIGSRCTVPANCTGFIGNDSGLRVNDPNSAFPPIDLGPADAAGGAGGPAGSLCFGSSSNWGSLGSDGCADNKRTGTTQTVKPGVPGTCDMTDTCDTGAGACVNAPGTPCAVDADCFACVGGPTPGSVCTDDASCSSADTICNGGKDDNHLNKYYGPCFLIGTSTLEYQLDAPMGTLLTETNKKFFALAFFASSSRNGDPNDFNPGDYKLDALGRGTTNRGDANPKPGDPNAADIIPWQPIPGPVTDPNFFASAVLAADPNSAMLSMNWSGVRLVDDGSIRMSADGTLGGCTGVGARDCGPLVRYQVQRAPINSVGVCVGGDGVAGLPNPGTCVVGGGACSVPADCPVGPTCGNFNIATPLFSTSGTSMPATTVLRDSCIRLRTIFGKVPATTVLTVEADARNGRLGDIGYQVDSGILQIGKTLVSANAVLKVAAKNKNAVLIEFDTTGELDVTRFDIVGKDAKGERVIGKVSCTECGTGRGAHYSTVIPAGDVRGAKSVLIVTQPSGARSNELPIE